MNAEDALFPVRIEGHDLPVDRLACFKRKPGEAVTVPTGTGDTPWIQETDAADGFITRHVGVAVKKQVARRGKPGRDVLEMDTVTFENEIEGERPAYLVIAVATNYAD